MAESMLRLTEIIFIDPKGVVGVKSDEFDVVFHIRPCLEAI